MGRRGQITTFIVLGIIILFAVGFVIYAAGIQGPLKLFTTRESEIQQYIGTCLEQTSESAINALGITGGYITVPDNIKVNDRSYFSFAPRTEPKIPLWYYRGEPRVPTKQFMEQEINDYVLKNINPCFNNFEPFKERYSMKLNSNATVNTTIADTSVFVKFNYPLELQDKQTSEITKLDFVGRTLNVKLGRIHDMAVEILQTENRLTFFENTSVDLLGTNINFPFTGLDFSCTPTIWKKSDLTDFAKNMISNNIGKVTVEGNPSTLYNSNDLYAQNHLVFPMEKTYSDIFAAFSYPTTARFELHVRPNDRELLKSNVGRPLGGGIVQLPLCINTYHFTYDIEYPLLTTLQDRGAFDSRGFTFNFAFPVTINHNQGEKTDFPVTSYESVDLNYDFCQRTTTQQADIRVKDAYTFEELYQAPVQYKCVRYLCDLGNTDATTGVYRLLAKMPSACTNGILMSHPEGYLEGQTVYDGSGSAEIFVKPLRAFKVNIIKHDSDNNFQRTDSLQSIESVSMTISSIDNPGFEQFYTSDSPDQTINLVYGDGKYHIEALLVQGDRVIGGYSGDWNARYADMAGTSQITFHLVQKIPLAVTEDEQASTSEYLFSDTSYQDALKPTFS